MTFVIKCASFSYDFCGVGWDSGVVKFSDKILSNHRIFLSHFCLDPMGPESTTPLSRLRTPMTIISEKENFYASVLLYLLLNIGP